MKILRIRALTVTFGAALLLAACGGNGGASNGEGGCDSTGFSEITASSITLKWKVDGTDLKVRVSAPTTGWVAFGILPAVQNLMEGGNFVIGYYEDGEVAVRDDYADTAISHKSDLDLGGTNDVSETCGSESGGETEIGFTIPLDSGDAFDRAIVPGDSCKVGLAYALDGADNFLIKHGTRTMIQQAF